MNDLGFRFEEFMFKFLAVNKDVIIELGKKCMSVSMTHWNTLFISLVDNDDLEMLALENL